MIKKMLLAVSVILIFSCINNAEAGKSRKEKEREKEQEISQPRAGHQKLKKSHSQKEKKKESKKSQPKSSAEKPKKPKSKLQRVSSRETQHSMQHGLEQGAFSSEWIQPEILKLYFQFGENPLDHLLNLGKGVTHHKIKGEEVVVSMTSHPPRIETTYLSVLSILMQDVKPNHIILYLAELDFPDKKLPNSLTCLMSKGLEIRFSEKNYKVATKLIPALQEFPDATIVTADDDRIYAQGWLGALLDQHHQYPQDIISPSARKYVFSEGSFYGNPKAPSYPHIDYLYQSHLYDAVDFGIFEGFSGVLYPPQALNQEVFNFPHFRALTPYADDVWFQVMATLNGTMVRGLAQDIQEKYASPPEVEGTQASGLFHKHLRANDWMAYRALFYYGLLGKVKIPVLSNLKCQDCKREIKLHKFPEKLKAHKHGKGEVECSTCLNTHLRKVLCIGAYPYGNIGDKLYEIIFKEMLGKSFKMYFAPDTARISRKGKYIEMKSKKKDLKFDALIIGGGGILRDFPKKHAIYHYMQSAIEKQKPLFFVSTGLQTTLKNPSVKDTRTILGDSAELMKKASLIFVRSVRDRLLLEQVLGEDVSHKLAVAPDLGYLAPQLMKISPALKKYITLIQTGSASIENEYIRQLIAQAFKKNPDSELVVMNWGGPEDPTEKEDFREYALFSNKTKELYPSAKVYMGDSISPELKKLRYSAIETRASDLTPDSALKIVAQSHLVISGRYHGLVIAKALGIPCVAPISTHKVLAEKESPLDIKQTAGQLERIKEYINRNSDSLASPKVWDEDARNTAIVKLHETFGLPIPHVQSMDNASIWKHLAYGTAEL